MIINAILRIIDSFLTRMLKNNIMMIFLRNVVLLIAVNTAAELLKDSFHQDVHIAVKKKIIN